MTNLFASNELGDRRPVLTALLALTVASWVQVTFGALVRAKKAGLACPDWPKCLGVLVPDVKVQGVIYEFGHRVFALLVSALFVWAAWQVWRHPALRAIRKWIWALAGVLVVQIVLGGLTVLIVHRGDGDPRPATWTVVTHLILGNVFAALALACALQVHGAQGARNLSQAVRPLAALWTASVVAQFVMGGNIAGNIAGLVCTEFPTCYDGIWFPSFSGLIGWQVLHRLNAYLLVVLAGALVWKTHRNEQVGRWTKILLGLVVLQAAVGGINIVSFLHTAVTTAHSLLAALLFSATAALWVKLGRTAS